MKVRLIPGEPSSVMSGPALRMNLNGYDAVLIVAPNASLDEVVAALIAHCNEPIEPNEGTPNG